MLWSNNLKLLSYSILHKYLLSKFNERKSLKNCTVINVIKVMYTCVCVGTRNYGWVKIRYCQIIFAFT